MPVCLLFGLCIHRSVIDLLCIVRGLGSVVFLKAAESYFQLRAVVTHKDRPWTGPTSHHHTRSTPRRGGSAARSVLSSSLDWHDVSSLPHDLLHGSVGVQPDPYSHSGRIESRHTPTRFTPRRGG